MADLWRTLIAICYVQSPSGHASFHGRTTVSGSKFQCCRPVCVEQPATAPTTTDMNFARFQHKLKTFLFRTTVPKCVMLWWLNVADRVQLRNQESRRLRKRGRPKRIFRIFTARRNDLFAVSRALTIFISRLRGESSNFNRVTFISLPTSKFNGISWFVY